MATNTQKKIVCQHPKEKQTLVVTEAFDIWEVTKIKCTECNQFIKDESKN